jgi:hypothetical protein
MVRLPRLPLAAIFLCAATAALAAVPTLPPDELRPGQKAAVRTVFEGQKIEEFEAEIVGVLKGGRASGDMILARATSERVLRTGIAQGMSGSPVYVDGRLVGALSGGWSFSREPLFAITPIGEMLEVLEHPWPGDAGVGTAGPTGVEPGARAASSYRELRWSDPVPGPALEPVAPASGRDLGAPARLPIPVACAGLAPGALSWADQLLAPLGLTAVPGGGAGRDADVSTELEPGSAVAIELMRGDLQLAAIGTITWRDGDRVLIFGHPFFQSGSIRLPIAAASITTVVSSQVISFKLGTSGRPMGVADQDRRAAVAGRLGPAPGLMPVTVNLAGEGLRERTFRFESIEDRALAPQLVGLAALNSLLESGGTGAGQTVRWTLALHRRGSEPLVLSEAATGGGLTTSLASGMAQPLAFLYNNPYAALDLDSVTVRLEVRPGEDLWTLRGLEVLDAAVRPGGTMRVRCQAERWRGGRKTVDIALRVPEEVPEGRYLLWAGGGAELNRFEAARLPGRYRPASLDEAWRRIGGLRRSDRLYVALIARAPEVTRDGRDYPELPTSALALLAGGLAAEDASRRGSQAVLDEAQQSFGGHLDGEVQLEVLVDPKAP